MSQSIDIQAVVRGLAESLQLLVAAVAQPDARPVWTRLPSADDGDKCPYSGLSRSALVKLVNAGEIEAKSASISERSGRSITLVRVRSEGEEKRSIDAWIEKQPKADRIA